MTYVAKVCEDLSYSQSISLEVDCMNSSGSDLLVQRPWPLRLWP